MISAPQPGGVRSASVLTGVPCAPSGMSSTMQRCESDRRATTSRQTLALASQPLTNTSTGPLPLSKYLMSPAGTRTMRAVPSSGER